MTFSLALALSVYYLRAKWLFAQTCILIMLFEQCFKYILHDLLKTLAESLQINMYMCTCVHCTVYSLHINICTLQIIQYTCFERVPLFYINIFLFSLSLSPRGFFFSILNNFHDLATNNRNRLCFVSLAS